MSTKRAAFLSITPMVPTGCGLGDALKFYKEQLGFSVLWEGSGGAGISRD